MLLIQKILKKISQQYNYKYPDTIGPIGVFDSGLGGLTILKKLMEKLPQYDYIFLGDNARAPYGERSLDVIYEFTRKATEKLIKLNCPLIILACNTASVDALEKMNKKDLIKWNPNRKIFGVIDPTVKKLGSITRTKHVGLFGTACTINSNVFENKTKNLFPDIVITGQACPLFVPLVENNEYGSNGADYYVKKYIDQLLSKDVLIDTVILGCTHFPLLIDKIKTYMPKNIYIVEQGEIVADNLLEYLGSNQNIDNMLTKNGSVKFYTTGNEEKFSKTGSLFLGKQIKAKKINLEFEDDYDKYRNISFKIGISFILFIMCLFLCLFLRRRLLKHKMIKRENVDFRLVENNEMR